MINFAESIKQHLLGKFPNSRIYYNDERDDDSLSFTIIGKNRWNKKFFIIGKDKGKMELKLSDPDLFTKLDKKLADFVQNEKLDE